MAKTTRGAALLLFALACLVSVKADITGFATFPGGDSGELQYNSDFLFEGTPYVVVSTITGQLTVLTPPQGSTSDLASYCSSATHIGRLLISTGSITGRWVYVCESSGNWVQQGGSGGGGSSTLAVNHNNVLVSSPTSDINFMSPLRATLQGTTSAQITLSPVSLSTGVFGTIDISTQTNLSAQMPVFISGDSVGLDTDSMGGTFIFNSDTLQSGATFYVSSGAVLGQLSVGTIKFRDGTIQVTSAPATSGGGGGSSLAVFSNFDGVLSSPTTTISIGDALTLTVVGSTAVLNLDPSSATLHGQFVPYYFLDADGETVNSILFADPENNNFALDTRLVFDINTATLKTDYLRASSSATIIGQIGVASIRFPDGTVQITSAPATSGGGGSSLQVFSNFDGVISSPTTTLSIGDALKLSVTGSTAIITVDFSSVPSRANAILNQNTLQAGATFYVSSGTVAGLMTATSFYATNVMSIGSDDLAHVISGISLSERLSIHAEGAVDLAEVSVHRHSDIPAFGPFQIMSRSRGTESSESIVQDGDNAGRVFFAGYDGTDYHILSEIRGEVDGPPASNQVPGSLVFGTTRTGDILPTEALIINSSQTLILPNVSPGVVHVVAGSSQVVTALVSLSTEVIGVLPLANMSAGATYYIQLRDTLQAGATYFVSSGTVSGQLSVGTIKFPDGTIQVTSATAGGSGSPGGSNTQFQYNDASSFAGSSILTQPSTYQILISSVANVIFSNVDSLTISTGTNLFIGTASVSGQLSVGTIKFPDGTIQITSAPASGSGSLEVFSNFDATRLNPATAMSIGDALKFSVSGTTAVVTVDFSSVASRSEVIFNQNTLQTGSAFHVSSATVSGNFVVTEQIRASSGSLSTPSISYAADRDTGFFNVTNNTIRTSVGGLHCATFQSDQTVNFASTVYIVDGVVGVPSLAFGDDLNTGIFSEGTDQWVAVTGGIGVATFSLTGVSIRGNTTGVMSTSDKVGYSFTNGGNDVNYPATGVYGDFDSITLPAGVWSLSTIVTAQANGATVTGGMVHGITTISGNSASGLDYRNNYIILATPTAAAGSSGSIANYIVTPTSLTTYYVKYQSVYVGGPPTASGRITAIRLQ